jgi:bidirectional [NiFe] hydrogenase diaphorase subunit
VTTCSLRIDGKVIQASEGQTILELCRNHAIPLPTLCFLEGLSGVGACRLCLVEVKGSPKLQPACLLPAEEGMEISTDTEPLRRYRRQIVELLFAERNHVCAVCVSSGACRLQEVAYAVGMDHVRYPYLHPATALDASHPLYLLDHGRCILCTRCVRACDELERAHTLDVAWRGSLARIITDLAQPWGSAESCTSCGRCVAACPTGALSERSQLPVGRRPWTL